MADSLFMRLRRPSFQITLRESGGWISAFGIAALFVWLVDGAPPVGEDLRHWHGPLQEVSVNGKGSASWLIGGSDGEELRFKSYHGLDWPGMHALKAGSVVDVWYAPDPLPRRGIGTKKSYWIWRLVHDGEELVPYDGVAALWNRDRRWMAWAGVGLLMVGAALWMVARARGDQVARAVPTTPLVS